MVWRCFTLDIAGNVAHLRLNRGAEHNTMIPEFWRELPQIVRDIDAGAQARVLVLSAEGKNFSAGMDLSAFAPGAADASQNEPGRARALLRQTILDLQDCFNQLERARLPVLAAVQGGCIGGALDMICACDCRFASEDAYFVIQEIHLGMTADLGVFPRLCRLMPEGMVRQMAYTGMRLSAMRARELGLINEVFADSETMLAHVLHVAKDIAAKSPLAVHGCKTMLNYARDHSIADTLDYIATWQAGLFHPHSAAGDMQEALRAKAEKRAPQFSDLPVMKKPFA